MNAPDLIDRVRQIKPLVPDWSAQQTAQATALLERIVSTDVAPVRNRRQPRMTAALLLAGLASVASLSIAVWPGAASATERVAAAAKASAHAGSGRATMTVTSTLDGAPNDGTVELAWSGTNEQYVFDYPNSSGRFETRALTGKVVQKTGDGDWKVIGRDTSAIPDSGGLA
jgi:hypothetical protein